MVTRVNRRRNGEAAQRMEVEMLTVLIDVDFDRDSPTLLANNTNLGFV